MTQIIPSILVSEKKLLLEQATAVADVLPMIQIDIADGVFVSNTTWAQSEEAPEVVAEHLTIDCELHLMVADPLEEARKWEDVPQVKRVLAHYESNPEHFADILARIHSYGWEVGVVLNPETPIAAVEPFIEEVDGIMFMGVKPGEQRQSLIPEVLEKMMAFKKNHPNVFMEIDGGVNEKTLGDILKTGVDAICPGSAIFGNEKTPAENVKNMKSLINTLTG
jgi:ribulose-phosphate 3-epimerase